jgi:hypothetical protein
MAYDYLDQPVLSSLIIQKQEMDSFFSPALLGHSGFSADGLYYVNGIVNPQLQASWYTETAGTERSSAQAFPDRTLVIASRASLALLSAVTMELWMLFYLGDDKALRYNPTGVQLSYTPSGLSWANGLLTLNLTADAGDSTQAPYALTIDFTRDQVYADTHTAQS